MAALDGRWLLSDEEQLWCSVDGLAWKLVAGSEAALVLSVTAEGILAGTENGVQLLDSGSFAVIESYGLAA